MESRTATVSVIVFVLPWGVVSKAFPQPAPGLGLERCILGHGQAIQMVKPMPPLAKQGPCFLFATLFG